MRKAAICVLALVVVCVAGCATGQSYVNPNYDFSKLESVAVVDIEGALRSKAAKDQIATYFEMELLKRGYRVVERNRVEAILAEQDFQASDVTRPEGAVKAGRILNVGALMVVNIPNFGEEISMSAKILNAEDGEILWIGEGTGGTGRTLATIAGATVGAVGGIAAGGSRSGKVVGGVAGGILGGVAGRALSPQEQRAAQKIIQNKVCKKLPSRLP